MSVRTTYKWDPKLRKVVRVGTPKTDRIRNANSSYQVGDLPDIAMDQARNKIRRKKIEHSIRIDDVRRVVEKHNVRT